MDLTSCIRVDHAGHTLCCAEDVKALLALLHDVCMQQQARREHVLPHTQDQLHEGRMCGGRGCSHPP